MRVFATLHASFQAQLVKANIKTVQNTSLDFHDPFSARHWVTTEAIERDNATREGNDDDDDDDNDDNDNDNDDDDSRDVMQCKASSCRMNDGFFSVANLMNRTVKCNLGRNLSHHVNRRRFGFWIWSRWMVRDICQLSSEARAVRDTVRPSIRHSPHFFPSQLSETSDGERAKCRSDRGVLLGLDLSLAGMGLS
jgi:hypothetical protein